MVDDPVKTQDSSAQFKNGVLMITVPKQEIEQPKIKSLEIKDVKLDPSWDSADKPGEYSNQVAKAIGDFNLNVSSGTQLTLPSDLKQRKINVTVS